MWYWMLGGHVGRRRRRRWRWRRYCCIWHVERWAFGMPGGALRHLISQSASHMAQSVLHVRQPMCCASNTPCHCLPSHSDHIQIQGPTSCERVRASGTLTKTPSTPCWLGRPLSVQLRQRASRPTFARSTQMRAKPRALLESTKTKQGRMESRVGGGGRAHSFHTRAFLKLGHHGCI